MSLAGGHKATKRVQKEIAQYQKDPPDFAPEIHVQETNLNMVYFLIEGPDETPYEGGMYVLQMTLPADYPMRPPGLAMMTPTGRFAVREKICTTFTDFHPESWSPSYNFSTIIKSFISFMTEDPDNYHIGHYKDPRTGGYARCPANERKALAKKSREENIKAGLDRFFPCIREDPAKRKAAKEAAKKKEADERKKKEEEEKRAKEGGAGPSKPAETAADSLSDAAAPAPAAAPAAAAGAKRKAEAPPANGKSPKAAATGKGAKGKGNAGGQAGKGKAAAADDDDEIVVVIDD